MALSNILVLARPGWSMERLHPADGVGRVLTAGGGVLGVADAPEVAVTATALREKLATGNDVSSELPAAVLDYIQRNEIYGMKRA